MEHFEVENSSQVSRIGYNKETKVFEVTYKSGVTYHYSGVAADLWDKAKTAESVGKFVNAYIKPHKYKLVK